MTSPNRKLADELNKVQQAIAAQEQLANILPPEQLAETLARLRQKEAELRTQIAGDLVAGDKVGGDKVGRDKIVAHIVNIYREGGGRVPDDQLRRAIAAYASWVMETYGRIPLRGLSSREFQMPDPNLPDVYVSLVAQKEASHWQEREEKNEPVDMRSLLQQGKRLAITGAPGSGKTTFLRHIAYLLAYALHTGDETPVRQQLNLDGPLPLPIYLSLADFHRFRQEKKDGTLIDFISYTLIQQHGVYGLPPDFFAQMLSQENTVCLLLDSLDEIPDEVGRFQATHAVMQLASNRSIGQILVASRDHAYVGRTMLARPFRRFVVQPMRPEQIAALTQRWCAAVYPPDKVAREANELQEEVTALEAIRKKQGEQPLVDTPLMVTIVAIVHYNNRKLPQQRAALYEKCVTALLAEQHKSEEGQGQSQPDLEMRGGSLDTKRGYLARLAYEMMCQGTEQNKEQDAGRSASLAQMESWLLPAFAQAEGEENAPAKFTEFQRAMCDRASILHERAGRVEFTHLTFQEFLCAHHLAVNHSPTEIAAFFQAENRVLHSWWREAILLTIGHLGKTASPQALKLTQAMLNSFPDDETGLAAAELAAAGLLELEIPAPTDRQLARQRLIALIGDKSLSASHAVRAQAGRTLSQLGDTRPGVGVFVREDGLKLPDIAWGKEIAPGTYPYQDGTVEFKQAYQLARYPITYAQFQCFIDAPDFEQDDWWNGMPEFGVGILNKYPVRKIGNQRFTYANHPRETVSWYQAVAFCRWLSHHTGQDIRLPHEEEWEVAARFPDGRSYPWGNEWDINKTYKDEGRKLYDLSGNEIGRIIGKVYEVGGHEVEGGVGQTTSVGLFPNGQHPELDLYDLSSNVWEWCQNKYGDSKDSSVDASGERRSLRGGSSDITFRTDLEPYIQGSPTLSRHGFRIVVCRSPSK